MPKLTLRDLFFIVTLAAVLVAWWVDHRQMARKNAAAQQSAEAWMVEALACRERSKATKKYLNAVIRELAPERVGSDFEFPIDAGGDEGEQP